MEFPRQSHLPGDIGLRHLGVCNNCGSAQSGVCKVNKGMTPFSAITSFLVKIQKPAKSLSQGTCAVWMLESRRELRKYYIKMLATGLFGCFRWVSTFIGKNADSLLGGLRFRWILEI